MGGMCRIVARQSNAFGSPFPLYVRIVRTAQQRGLRDTRETMPPFGHRDTRYSGYPVESAKAVPAPLGQAFSRDPSPRSAQVRPGIRLDESTVIKSLSKAGEHPHQDARLRRPMVASAHTASS